MLNEKMDSVVLVKGWKKGANWSFPRGKINKDEPDLACAVREVYEETGYDIKAAGLVGNEEDMKYIEITMREQHMRLYFFRGIPMDTHFEPRTRKEISKIAWYKLSDLPTIRNKKQQQEGKGEDLAVNANRFYMVAPFLVPLKKWISAQRKLDKAKQVNGTTAAVEGELAHTVEHDVGEEVVLHPSKEDLGRLLDSLRQSAQPEKMRDLPEVSGIPIERENITAQLKSVLGVPLRHPMQSATEAAASQQTSMNSMENTKSNALLALLRGNPTAQEDQTPQTPLEQVIGFPAPPTSPPHPHHRPSRFSPLPPPNSSFPAANDPSSTASVSNLGQPQASVGQVSQPPQARSIPPLQQPAQLVSRASRVHQKPVREVSARQVLAPYQRTGDPQFSQYAQASGNIASSVPPASRLPLPKLTAQTSALLDLFKSGLPSKTPITNDNIKASKPDEAETVPANPSTNTIPLLDFLKAKGEDVSQQSRNKLENIRGPPGTLVAHQRLAKTPSISVNETDRPTSEHQDKLLSLFRTPTIRAVEPVDFLQPPSDPVELSALPMTPEHSRNNSRANQLPKHLIQGSAMASKRPRRDTSKVHNPPVSATVNGPLNVPQFDMLAKVSKESKHGTHNSGHKKSPKKSPITILSRPSSSHTQPPAPLSSTGVHGATSPPKPQKADVVPQIQTLTSPVRNMPPTPNLKGHPAPLKPFHPQILRRPAPTEDPSEPSPIQPLPSPKHTLLANRTTQPADHKKSLLSIFTKPSPLVSPAVTAPTSAIDPTGVISPLSEKPTPREQADAAFANIAKDVRPLPQEINLFPIQAAVSPSRTSSVKAVVAVGGNQNRAATASRKTPTTPVDRKFLLGYLEGVAKGGR